jgi:LmbE family N-acetylglucosaminyl deacetylase
MKTFLTVTAHPDDEILGFGGGSSILTNCGHRVHNLILSGSVEARSHRPEYEELLQHTNSAQKIVGAQSPILGPFPNIKFNLIPHLEIVQFIEKYIEEIQPDVVITHHPYDLNNDHYHTSKACQAAVRLFQRKPIKPLKALYFMEIPSSTDWAFPVDGQQFRPDTFIEIGEEGLSRKLEALYAYEGVMRKYPHPRSDEAVRALAVLRGSQVGRNLCEGFQTAMNIIEP